MNIIILIAIFFTLPMSSNHSTFIKLVLYHHNFFLTFQETKNNAIVDIWTSEKKKEKKILPFNVTFSKLSFN